MRRLTVILLSLLCVLTSFSFVSCQTGFIPKRVEAGKPFQVTLNGLSQTIMVHENSSSNPVLLVLHGGPGYAMLPLMHATNPELEDEFIVVNWDQRGAGLTPDDDESKMTLATFIQDAHELTLWLKRKFNKDKIYILGHSFGTVLGIFLVKEYPTDYYAFVGVGQTVNVFENEQYMYDWALSQAIQKDDQASIDLLGAIGRPAKNGTYLNDVPESAADQFDDPSAVTMHYVTQYGGDLYGKTNTDEIDALIMQSGIYDQEEWDDAWAFSQSIFEDPEVWSFDFKDAAQGLTDFVVPVYFLMGQHDYDTPVNLFEEYYNLITSTKTWVKFDNSAHFPFYEEPQKFRDELLKVKKDTLG